MILEIKGGNLPVAEMQELVELLAKTYDYTAGYDGETGKITLTPKEPDQRTADLFAGIDFRNMQ